MARLKNYFTIRDPYTIYISRPIQRNHFQANLIWCEGTFNRAKIDGPVPGQVGMGRQRLERPERVGRLEWEITEREVQRRVRPSLVCHWFLNFF
jgi:hypothetical protein